MTSERNIRTMLNEVLEIHGDHIGTHYPDCWKYHVACLAAVIRDALEGDNA